MEGARLLAMTLHVRLGVGVEDKKHWTIIINIDRGTDAGVMRLRVDSLLQLPREKSLEF